MTSPATCFSQTPTISNLVQSTASCLVLEFSWRGETPFPGLQPVINRLPLGPQARATGIHLHVQISSNSTDPWDSDHINLRHVDILYASYINLLLGLGSNTLLNCDTLSASLAVSTAHFPYEYDSSSLV